MEDCLERFCNLVSQAVGEDPAGTAPYYDLLVLLEVPLPWEREIWRSPAFPPGVYELGAAALERGLKFRLLCVAPDPEHSRPGQRRVLICRRPSAWMASYRRHEYLLPPDEVMELVRAAIEGEELPAGLPADGVRDMLVCTHGSTDAACARYGYPLYEHLRRMRGSEHLRVWRVSHFGGHRFAPAMLELPEGRWWGHLEPQALEQIIRREGPVPALHRHYRGWGGLATPFEQVLERAIFEQEGWGWLGLQKRGEVLEHCPNGTWAEVRIAYRSADGAQSGSYEGRVEVSHQVVTALASRRAPEPVDQYSVTRLERPRIFADL